MTSMPKVGFRTVQINSEPVVELCLNSGQERVVNSRAEAITVVAGAGSGKTEVVARRLERILVDSKHESFRVLALSYTVRAADELKQRLASRLGDLHRRVDADTVHGFAWEALRRHGTRIGLPVDPEVISRDEDRLELLFLWLKREGYSPWADPEQIMRKLDVDRARSIENQRVGVWQRVLAESGVLDYQGMIDRCCELMENPSIRRIYAAMYRHVVVDEAQNLTKSQYRLLTTLIGDSSGGHIPAMLVGDERQSIVGFAGADRTLITAFEREYSAQRIELDVNYRSARQIDRVSKTVAHEMGLPQEEQTPRFSAHGEVRVEVYDSEHEEGMGIASWVGRQLNEGVPACAVAPGESTTIAAEEIAVLGRSAVSLLSTRDALNALDIPNASASTPDDWVTSPAAQAIVELISFRGTPHHSSARRRLERICNSREVEGRVNVAERDPPGSFVNRIQRRAVENWKDVAELFECSNDPDITALTGLCDASSPQKLVESLEALEIHDPDWTGDLQQISDAWRSFIDRTPQGARSFTEFRYHIVRRQRGNPLDPGVRLLTVHKAQGSEFKSVAVVACNDGQFPDFRACSPEALAEELRTFYVAVSRPSRVLMISRSTTRNTRFGPRHTEPSRFLDLVTGNTDIVTGT